MDEREEHPAQWALAMWAAIGTGLLSKGSIAAVFPVAAAILYLGLTHQLLDRAAVQDRVILECDLVLESSQDCAAVLG